MQPYNDNIKHTGTLILDQMVCACLDQNHTMLLHVRFNDITLRNQFPVISQLQETIMYVELQVGILIVQFKLQYDCHPKITQIFYLNIILLLNEYLHCQVQHTKEACSFIMITINRLLKQENLLQLQWLEMTNKREKTGTLQQWHC